MNIIKPSQKKLFNLLLISFLTTGVCSKVQAQFVKPGDEPPRDSRNEDSQRKERRERSEESNPERGRNDSDSRRREENNREENNERPPRFEEPAPPRHSVPPRNERPPRFEEPAPPRHSEPPRYERPPRFDEPPPRYHERPERPPRYDDDYRDDYRRRIEEERRRRIENHYEWNDRYHRWHDNCPRPSYPRYRQPIDWRQPMPTPTRDNVYWDHQDILIVADNIEYLAQRIYDIMEPIAPTTRNQEYSARLMRVLYQLTDASSAFHISVQRYDQLSDTLYYLFYLEDTVSLTENTLDGYSQEYRVEDEMKAIRYYINELLWTYRQRN